MKRHHVHFFILPSSGRSVLGVCECGATREFKNTLGDALAGKDQRWQSRRREVMASERLAVHGAVSIGPESLDYAAQNFRPGQVKVVRGEV